MKLAKTGPTAESVSLRRNCVWKRIDVQTKQLVLLAATLIAVGGVRQFLLLSSTGVYRRKLETHLLTWIINIEG